MSEASTVYWNLVPEKSNNHILSLRDPEGFREAWIKGDGCLEYYRIHSIDASGDYDPYDMDFLHICEINQEIERLQQLRDTAVEYFREQGIEWPVG